MAEFPVRARSALSGRSPNRSDDVGQVMRLAGYEQALPKDKDTILKINISWIRGIPACSSTPWQIEGTIRELSVAAALRQDRRGPQ